MSSASFGASSILASRIISFILASKARFVLCIDLLCGIQRFDPGHIFFDNLRRIPKVY
jgi:hypothetical protein